MSTADTALAPIPDAVRTAGYRAFVAAMAETVDGEQIYARTLDAIATAWQASHAITALPNPDGTDNEGDPLWYLGTGQVVIAYCDTDGFPLIRLPDGEDVDPEWASLYAAVLAAGVRTSHQLAAEFAEQQAATAAAIEELVDQGLVEIVEDGDVDG